MREASICRKNLERLTGLVRTASSGRGDLVSSHCLGQAGCLWSPADPWSPSSQSQQLSVPAAHVPPLPLGSRPHPCFPDPPAPAPPAHPPMEVTGPALEVLQMRESCPLLRLAPKSSRPVGAPHAALGFFPYDLPMPGLTLPF